MKLCTIIAAVVLAPVYMFAGIAGTYEVVGEGPDSLIEYNATLVIEKNDSVYTAVWTYPNGTSDIGTGVRKDDSIAFVFNENNSSSFGVQLYEIHGHVLTGPWVRYGATESGHETAERVHHFHCGTR